MTLKASEQIQRLKERLEASESLCKTVCELGASMEEQNSKLRTELASVTARLAAAEEKVKHGTAFSFRPIEFRFSNGGWEVKNWRTLEYLDEDGSILQREFTWVHRTLDAAIAAAVSAGWMKPLGEGGGE